MRTLYVAVTGSDSNTGLAPNLALKTIGHAAKISQAGDVISVATGVYPEGCITPPTPSVSFVAAPGAELVGYFELAQPSLTVSGFMIQGPTPPPAGWQAMPQICIDQPGLVVVPSEPWAQRSLVVYAKYKSYIAYEAALTGSWSVGCWISAPNVTVTGCVVSGFTVGVQVNGNVAGTMIEGCAITGGVYGILGYAVGSPGAAGSVPSMAGGTIQCCYFAQCLDAGVCLENASGVTIQRCCSELNGLFAYALNEGSSNCTITGNVGRGCGSYSETMSSPGSSCFNFFEVGPGNVCSGNVAIGQIDQTLLDGENYIADTSSSPVTFSGNFGIGAQGAGAVATQTNGCVFTGNTFVANGKSGGVVTGAGVIGTVEIGNLNYS